MRPNFREEEKRGKERVRSTSAQVLVVSARRRRALPEMKELKKVWKWAVVEEVFSFLQGNHFLAKFSDMQIWAIRVWNTVISSDMNPNNINSALILTNTIIYAIFPTTLIQNN